MCAAAVGMQSRTQALLLAHAYDSTRIDSCAIKGHMRALGGELEYEASGYVGRNVCKQNRKHPLLVSNV